MSSMRTVFTPKPHDQQLKRARSLPPQNDHTIKLQEL